MAVGLGYGRVVDFVIVIIIIVIAAVIVIALLIVVENHHLVHTKNCECTSDTTGKERLLFDGLAATVNDKWALARWSQSIGGVPACESSKKKVFTKKHTLPQYFPEQQYSEYATGLPWV